MSQRQDFFTQSAFCSHIRRGELDCIQIDHPFFQATLLPQGAQLISFKTTESDNDWIWLSEDAQYKKGTSLRGGIPICWPWFGDADKNPDPVQASLATNVKLPAHGFARTSDFQLVELYEATDRIELTLVLDVDRSDLFLPDLLLSARFCFTKQGMTLELITKNQGAQPASFSQALHTYFPTSAIDQTHIQGLSGARYYDCLDAWQLKEQQGNIAFSAETDRVYQLSAPAEADPRPLRLVTPESTRLLASKGSNSAIVWNPWIAKAARLSQFPDDGWQRMFCVETANAMDDLVTLEAGESYHLTLTLS